MSKPGDVGRLPSIATTNISLQAIVDADHRLDELSTARLIGEAAEAIHKLQKNGQALGTLSPLAIVVSSAGVRVDPPSGPTTAYCAPERLKGQTGDRRSDVFSLGVVLWEALAHVRLFEGATDDAIKKAVLENDIRPPSERNANVPAELDAICKKALARDPADRYQSTKVMAAEISAVLDDASYPESNERISTYLEKTFPAGAPKPERAKTPSSTGAAIAAKLAAANKTTANSANKTQMMGSLVSSDLLPPAASTEAAPTTDAAPKEEVKGESTKRIGDAPVTPAAPAPEAAATTPAPESPAPVTPSAPVVAAAEPAGKRTSSQRPAVSIASAETVQTPALVPTAAVTATNDTPTTGKVAGLPAMPPGASIGDADTQPEPILKASKADEPAPRPSQPAVDPRDAVSLPRRAESETGEMLGGWGWSDSHDPAPDGLYEDEVDEEKIRRKRLLLAIGGALGVIALILVIALAVGGSDDKKKTDEEQQPAVAEGPSRTAPEPTPAPAPEPTPAPVVAPGVGSGSAAAVDPEAAKAQELAAKAEADKAQAEQARLAMEAAEQAEKAKAEEARLAKEADDKAKAEQARLAKEEAAKAKAAKAEEARLAKEAADKARAEQARLAKEDAAKKKTAEPTKKKAEPKKVAKAPTPVDPYAETAPKVDPATAYKQGFQQYVRGDTAGALSTFKSSLSANPSYAPTHRGLGLVYEKMGNKAQAKTAFRRYLQLSPKASDAEQIRERMEKL